MLIRNHLYLNYIKLNNSFLPNIKLTNKQTAKLKFQNLYNKNSYIKN